jgi:hypothetical protein
MGAVDGIQELAHLSPAADSVPRQVDTLEEVGLRRFAGDELEIIDRRAAAFGRAESLALVHAPALACELGVGTTEERVIGPEIDGEELLGAVARWRRGPAEVVPEEPLRLPGRKRAQLVGESRRIAGRLESLDCEQRRR